MTAKSEQKERTHENILEASARLLRTRGISGASVAEVMKGAGLTVGGFYAHFASKEALIDDTLRRTSAKLRERLFAKLDEKPEAERADTVLRRYLTPQHRDEASEGCPFPAVVGEVATTASEHRDALAEQIEASTRELGGMLPSTRSLSGRHHALALLALMYGGLSLARALRGTPLSDEVLKACRAFGRGAARDEG